MENFNLSLGLYDDPEMQRQDDYKVDLYNSNIAILGNAMSGKTTMLKTILIRMHQVLGITDKEEIYILDFNNSLAEYEELPYVAAYFDAMQEENIRRIFKKIEERFEENIKALPGKAYYQCAEKDRPAHVTFIIDGLNTFFAENKYESYQTTLQRIVRDGLSKGVSVIFAANELAGGISRLINSFDTIIGFEMSKDKYNDLFNKRVEKPISLKGRGMATLKNQVYEFQAYYPYDFTDSKMNDKAAIKEIKEIYQNYFCKESERTSAVEVHENLEKLERSKAKKMKRIVSNLTKDSWVKYTGSTWDNYVNNECDKYNLTVGLEYYSLEPVSIDLKSSRTIAIYGKKKSGKSNLLSLIIEAATKIPNSRFVIWEDERKGVESMERAPFVQRALSEALRCGHDVKYCYSKEEFMNFITLNYNDNIDYEPDFSSEYDIIEYEQPKKIEDSQINGKSEFDIKKILNKTKAPTNPVYKKRIRENKENPFTVFIVQSRIFYQASSNSSSGQLINQISPFVSNGENKLFVFSDVQKIIDRDSNMLFNNWIDHAFLLDNILRFVRSNRGRTSVFNNDDEEEFKERFGECDLGDGFYFNIAFDEINKLKFIAQEITDK